MLDFEIVDAHLHLWDPKNLRYPWLDGNDFLNRSFALEDYNRDCGGVEVGKIVFMECACEQSSNMDEVAWVTDLAKKDRRIRGIVASAPLEMGGGVEETLAKLKENDLVKGIRCMINFEAEKASDLLNNFITGVNLLPRYGFSLDILIGWRDNRNLIRLLEKIPETPCILDHIGNPDVTNGVIEPWRSEIKEIAAFPNIVCKVSSLTTGPNRQPRTAEQLRPFTDCIFENFGFDRTVFAGDWPVSAQAASYPVCVETLLELVDGAPRGNLLKLFKENAERFYRV
jgi:L-fuconolactonase